MEMAISNFNTTADTWLSRLPAEFRFDEFDSTRPFIRQRTILAFRFYTTKLVISQPCLRRLAHQVIGTPSPSSVCDMMATTCVGAAQRTLDILPETPDINWLYEVSPWWCFLHYIMQSTTIILAELFARTLPGTKKATSLTKIVQKAIRWLCAMSGRDPSAHRAWLVCIDILSRHGLKFSIIPDD
jgi:hypothetical protein